LSVTANLRRRVLLGAIARGLLCWSVFLSMSILLATAQESALPESQVKAAFVLNFAKFVDWPPGAFSSPDAPFQMCVLGDGLIGKPLTELTAGKLIAGRTIQVLHLRSLPEARHCHVLFIHSSEKKRIGAIVDGLRDRPILTVGDTQDFAQAGVMINLYTEDDNIRFEIGLANAESAGLKVSSKLLALARIVKKSEHFRRAL